MKLKKLFKMWRIKVQEYMLKITTEAASDFKKAMLERLEVSNDFNVSWKEKSGFPFLKLTSREYYLQKDFEKIIEHYTRNILINEVLEKMLKHNNYLFESLEYFLNAINPGIRTNREYECEMGFEFIETREDKKIGFRYTLLPFGKNMTEPLLKQINEENIKEIIIIDWSLQDKVTKPSYGESLCFQDLTIRYLSVHDFFLEYFNDENIYNFFIDFLQKNIIEFQEYLGIVTIPRLTSHLLFSFRFEVEKQLLEHLQFLEKQKKTCGLKHQSSDLFYPYRIIDDDTRKNVHYDKLEERSLAFINNTCALKVYKEKKYYRALIGRSNFARCLITSEYLYNNYGKSDQFDFTAIVSGYLKSVEQLMFCIAKTTLDKKREDGKYFQIAPKIGKKENTIDFTSQNLNDGNVDTSIGALCFFFKNNKSLFNIRRGHKETLLNCLFCYADECRNDSFHKNNIDEWNRVDIIRSNTFFIYIALLGCCKIGGSEEETIKKLEIATDDQLSRIYYQLTTTDTLDFFIQFQDQSPIEICRPREEDYLLFDNYGIMIKDKLELEIEHFSGAQPELPRAITISSDNLPTRIWYEDETDWSITHQIDF